ncbi:hypothetical protein FOVG_05579 [Fusarium oxysporum f. sp. pisi HDV247]|uniref:Uncharacterized protein n=1 Tax=Fusarium oxysporum f. sp. pisi HDV247 TaxID=1080344 RepID=W9PFV3_FUSOX|nr:hypothetical protein FOVG_05579 [Fusarium oxysporum f. sp. pisi HDV247]
MLRQNTTWPTMSNSSSLHIPVSQLWRIYERFGKQSETVPEVHKAAVELVQKGLDAAVELYLGNPICFVNRCFIWTRNEPCLSRQYYCRSSSSNGTYTTLEWKSYRSSSCSSRQWVGEL